MERKLRLKINLRESTMEICDIFKEFGIPFNSNVLFIINIMVINVVYGTISSLTFHFRSVFKTNAIQVEEFSIKIK